MSRQILELKNINAKDLLHQFDLFKAPVDLIKLCNEMEIPVNVSTTLEKLYSGDISVDSKGQVNIWVNAMGNNNRQRFTLAHEIGHLINDIIPHIENHQAKKFEDPATNFQRSGTPSIEEYRANTFAADLLMPEELIIKEGKKIINFLKNKFETETINQDIFIEKMSEKFSVSKQAMDIKLKVLGLIE